MNLTAVLHILLALAGISKNRCSLHDVKVKGKSANFDVTADEDKLIVEKITRQSKFSVWMKIPCSENDAWKELLIRMPSPCQPSRILRTRYQFGLGVILQATN